MSAENCAHTVLTHSEVCSLTCVLNIPCKLMSMPDSIDMIHPIVDIEASFFLIFRICSVSSRVFCSLPLQIRYFTIMYVRRGFKICAVFEYCFFQERGIAAANRRRSPSTYINVVLLLRSLRAWSLGVVLVKVLDLLGA